MPKLRLKTIHLGPQSKRRGPHGSVYAPFTIHWRQSRPGFTLVDTLIGIIILLPLITILISVSGSLNTSRQSNLQSLAAKIASRQMETIRKGGFASLPPSTPTQFSDPDLSQLPNNTPLQSATDACNPPASPCKIKLVTVEVKWVQAETPKSAKVETLVYEYGLQ